MPSPLIAPTDHTPVLRGILEVHIYMYTYIYMYIYIHQQCEGVWRYLDIYVHIYIYIYMSTGRDF